MKKTLVAYFSATGTTELLAKRLATLVNGDLFKIVPEQPYTEADLNWMDLKSRSSVEMKNKTFRPKIANKVKNMEDYDRIFWDFRSGGTLLRPSFIRFYKPTIGKEKPLFRLQPAAEAVWEKPMKNWRSCVRGLF